MGFKIHHRLIRMLNAARTRRRMPPLESLPLDPRIRYPCYKSFDDYLDVERLRSLDALLRQRIPACLDSGRDVIRFDAGPLRLRLRDRRETGPRIIRLTSSASQGYLDIAKPELWQATPYAQAFPELMEFVGTLPFQATARIIIICDRKGRRTAPHRDHGFADVRHEFVWLRTNLDKKLFLFDPRSGRTEYVSSYSAWFDTVNQYHGADAADQLTFSIRVDGVFSDQLRRQIPTPSCNPASTAALWASLTRSEN